jgi:hypothetical protein
MIPFAILAHAHVSARHINSTKQFAGKSTTTYPMHVQAMMHKLALISIKSFDNQSNCRSNLQRQNLDDFLSGRCA